MDLVFTAVYRTGWDDPASFCLGPLHSESVSEVIPAMTTMALSAHRLPTFALT
jgi:hypothetical protein